MRVILTGAGKIFSAGGNVKEMADREGMFGLTRSNSGAPTSTESNESRGRWHAWKCR